MESLTISKTSKRSKRSKQTIQPCCSTVKTQQTRKVPVSKKDNLKVKKGKKDETLTADETTTSMLNKAKSISTQTSSVDFMADSPVLLDPCNQLNQLQSQSQSQLLGQSQAQSQSLPLVPVLLVEECITALILPVSKDVHSLQCSMQSHMQQLQTAISQLSANVSFLLSAYSAQTASCLSSTMPTTSTASVSGSSSLTQNIYPSTSSTTNPLLTTDTRVIVQPSDRNAASGPEGDSAYVGQPSAQRVDRCSTVAAVYLDQHEQIRRSRNVIFSGLAPSTQCSDKQLVETVLRNEFRVQPEIKQVRRLGRVDATDRVRPILLTLACERDAEHLLNNARVLRQSKDENIRRSVFVNAHLTRAQAQAAYQIRCRRRTTRQNGAAGSRTFVNSLHSTMPSNSWSSAPAAAADAMPESVDMTAFGGAVNASPVHSMTSSPTTTATSRLVWRQTTDLQQSSGASSLPLCFPAHATPSASSDLTDLAAQSSSTMNAKAVEFCPAASLNAATAGSSAPST